VRIKLTVVPVPRSNKATVSCVHGSGNNQLNPRRMLAMVEEHPSGRCCLHVSRTAVEKCYPERIFELLDGATQRGLGDRELVGGLGE
jgi:hypothetical protein